MTFGVVTARNLKVWSRFGVHSSDQGSFGDVYCSIDALANPKYEVPRLMLPAVPVKQKFESAVFLGMSWWHNHYHRLVDILPRLQLVQKELMAGMPLLVPPGLKEPQIFALRAVLGALGLEDAKVIFTKGEVIHIDDGFMPTRLSTPLDVSPLQRDVLRAALLPDLKDDVPLRLYVSRSDAAVRRIVNEDALKNLLEEAGFTTVTLSGLTMLQQVQLFSRASIVIGHHGAGFTNVLF